jgi:phosphodiesterase/alkaline phosphatase D-like protein
MLAPFPLSAFFTPSTFPCLQQPQKPNVSEVDRVFFFFLFFVFFFFFFKKLCRANAVPTRRYWLLLHATVDKSNTEGSSRRPNAKPKEKDNRLEKKKKKKKKKKIRKKLVSRHRATNADIYRDINDNAPGSVEKAHAPKENPLSVPTRIWGLLMGFWGRCIVLHVVLCVAFFVAVGYVYVLPRLADPDPWQHVALGGVTHNSAIIWVHVSPELRGGECAVARGQPARCGGPFVQVKWRPILNGTVMSELEADSGFFQTLEKDNYNIAVPLVNLQPDTMYQFSAIVQLTPRFFKEVYRWHFRTLPAPKKAHSQPFSFIFGSCLMTRSWPLDQSPLIDYEGPVIMPEPKPLFALLLGDNVYLDTPVTLPASRAYRQLLENLAFKRLTWNVPTYFLYDDHEIFNDADDHESEFFKRAVGTFDSYLGSRNFGERSVRYASFWAGQAAILLLDTRSYRSPTRQPDSEDKTMLGAAQRAFLSQWEKETRHDSAVRFVVSPVPWSSAVTRGDGWRRYLHERNSILDELAQGNGHTKTVLLSGDIHFGLIAEIRPGILEVSASPIMGIPLLAKLGNLEASGEKVIYSSQMKQHIGRIDVKGANVTLSVFAEVTGTGYVTVFQHII